MGLATRLFRIFFPFMTGYFVTSYFRSMTAVFAPYIQSELGISMTVMAFATAVYFLAFALMQVPIGVFTDHYGPRRTQSALFYIAGIGSIIFGLANGPTLLFVGRFLIGAGLSGGLMIAFAANRIWFNQNELPMLNGLTFSLGSIGAVASSLPTVILLEHFSWHTIAIWLGVITMIIATLILIFSPDPKRHRHDLTLRAQFSGLNVVFHDRYFWKVAPLLIVSLGAMLSFQSYWITPWLVKTIGANAQKVSLFLLVMAIVMVFSMPVGSYICSHFTGRRGRIEWVMGIGTIFSIATQAIIASRILPGSYILWGLYAFFSFFPMLAFTSIALHFPGEYAGRSSTGLNFLAFSGAFMMQYLFGFIAVSSIVAAFWTFIFIQIAALSWFCFGKVGEYV